MTDLLMACMNYRPTRYFLFQIKLKLFRIFLIRLLNQIIVYCYYILTGFFTFIANNISGSL